MRRFAIISATLLALAGCTNPYSGGQRAAGGALLGGGAGAGIAAITGGNPLTGALIGGGAGALGGYATTPQRPRGYYGRGGDEGRRYDRHGGYGGHYHGRH